MIDYSQWKTCRRCLAFQPPREFITKSDFGCISCRTAQHDGKAIPFEVLSSSAVFGQPKRRKKGHVTSGISSA